MTDVATRSRFELLPTLSGLLIEARSTLGPIEFASNQLSGHLETWSDPRSAQGAVPTHATLTVSMGSLRSGNALYDAELMRRIETKKFPITTVELVESTPIGNDGLHHLTGNMAIHGVTKAIQGTVKVSLPAEGHLLVTGEQVFDIRDFNLHPPAALMLRIYPDVRIRLHAEAAQV